MLAHGYDEEIRSRQAPIRISRKPNETALKSGYCIHRSLPEEYRYQLEESRQESQREKPRTIVAAAQRPNTRSLPNANHLPYHDKDELHEDNDSGQESSER